jgi:hypothetical protein
VRDTPDVWDHVHAHKHGIIELSVHAVQPPPDEGGQPARQSSTNRYTGCVDNNKPIHKTHTQPTDRPTPTTTTHESLAHDNMYICVCWGTISPYTI